MSDINRYGKTPIWMTIVIIICMLPVLAYPLLVSSMPTESIPKFLVWFYPAYVIVDGLCAWITYPQRPEVAWILLILMILTHIGMYFVI